MNTLIKGTFPVRFRRDGKDGVNVWLKYASVLDLTDSKGKSYPSKIFNEPTAECKYIGIGKGVGDEPTQGQYYDWKKYIGDDGTSFTAKGQAIAHYTTLTAYNSASKSVGLYLVDNTGGALLKYWNGSASGDRSVTDGDAYTTADKHLWIKDGVKWNDLGEIKGPKGDPGDDAVSYKLSSSISAIPLDNDAYPTVSSFTLTAYKFVGNASATFDDSYQLVAIISYIGSTTPITVSTKLGSSSRMTVYLRTDGLSSGSLIKDIRSVSCYLYHGSTTLESFVILPIKAGAAGVSYFPNNRGYWVINSTYSWSTKNMSRDMVVYNIGGTPYLFAVKTAGKSFKSTVSPDKDTNNWEQASSPYSMLFANFVYTDNASVGGFVFSEEQMRSTSTRDGKIPEPEGSNCNILLNGNTGKFVANDATIRGEVNATSGVFKNVKITNNCWIEPETEDGDGWFMNGGNDRVAAWRLGYSGKLTGQFTMNTVYYNGSNHPPTARLSFKTPNIQGGTSDGSTLISAYSNIDTPLANFSHANGMMVEICPSEGVGINFINNGGLATPVAFKGAGHGCLNGVIQGYKINNTFPSNGVIDLSYGNTVYCAKQGGSITLPTSTNCKSVLGTKGAFAIDLTIIAASGASNFKVYGKSDDNNTDCYLLDNNHANNWNATMSQGDVLQLKLIYTGSYFYAYIVSFKQ